MADTKGSEAKLNDMTHETTMQGTASMGVAKSDAAVGNTGGPGRMSPALGDKSPEDTDRDAEGKRKEAEAAEQDAIAKRQRLVELRAKAANSKLSEDERALAAAEADADEAMAKSEELRRTASSSAHPVVTGDVAAHPMAATDPGMDLGDHRAQRFGNIPANPRPAKGEHTDPAKMTTRMRLRSPNSPVPQETWIHPDLVGDYARAGWEVG